jgi:hypothetical protein
LRWRTALVVRELEQELEEMLAFRGDQQELERMMREKVLGEHRLSHQRARLAALQPGSAAAKQQSEVVRSARQALVDLDQRIGPLAKRASELLSPRWGPLMRCGNDKSHLARQIERYADVYTSRVSNLLDYTPYAYLRAPRVSLPHEVDLV